MKQFVRLYLDSSGNILHVFTQQDYPVEGEMVEEDRIAESVDLVLEHDCQFCRAREIMNNIEIRENKLRSKPGCSSEAVKNGRIRKLDASEISRTHRSKYSDKNRIS